MNRWNQLFHSIQPLFADSQRQKPGQICGRDDGNEYRRASLREYLKLDVQSKN
jgi:hypothetical protein